MLTDEFVEELRQADAQGERLLMSLWPGDQFYYRGNYHTIVSMQHSDNRTIIVRTADITDSPYTYTNLHGERVTQQPLAMYRFGAEILFPAILSDEHFAAENSESPASNW